MNKKYIFDGALIVSVFSVYAYVIGLANQNVFLKTLGIEPLLFERSYEQILYNSVFVFVNILLPVLAGMAVGLGAIYVGAAFLGPILDQFEFVKKLPDKIKRDYEKISALQLAAGKFIKSLKLFHMAIAFALFLGTAIWSESNGVQRGEKFLELWKEDKLEKKPLVQLKGEKLYVIACGEELCAGFAKRANDEPLSPVPIYFKKDSVFEPFNEA